MDDKYKTKTQLRAELAFVRHWLRNPEYEEDRFCNGNLLSDVSLTHHDRAQAQLSALISASRAVFKKNSFPAVAQSVFDLAKPVIGAEIGLVALVAPDGETLETISMDLGNLPRGRSKKLSLPVTGLRRQVIQTGKTFYVNDPADTNWQNTLPNDHIDLENVLFAPLMVKEDVAGMIIFGNKPGGFDRADTEIARAFGELLSISLANTHAYEALRSSEERFRQFFQNEPNYCLIISPEGLINDVNSAGLEAFHCKREELIGKPWYSVYDAESQAWIKNQRPDFRQPFTLNNQMLSILSHSGIRRNVLVSMHEIIGEQDKISHYITVHNDVTRRIKIEAEQRRLIDIYQEQSEILTESNSQLEAALVKVQESELKLQEQYQQEKKLHNELESEIRKRTDFTRTLVHELKTPLVPLVASASLLSEGVKEEPWQSIAANIEHGAVNLSKRIDELLDVAKGEVGTLEVCLKPIHLLPVINDVVRQTKDLIEVRKLNLVTEIHDPLPAINADSGRICQVITNLLNNAAKYTPAGGTITLKAYADAGNLKISVQDTGLGIPKEDQQQIFNSYYRASNSRTQFQGMGIGLYLCKKIMELHHGNISLQSKEGEGSIFIVTLPVVISPMEKRIPEKPAHKIVLAIEDRTTAQNIADNFNLLWPGSETAIITPVQEIPAFWEEVNIDALVLDLEIPAVDRVNGIDMIQQVKMRKNIPVVALISADANKHDFEKASRYSDGIFVKPVESRNLIKHLKDILEPGTT